MKKTGVLFLTVLAVLFFTGCKGGFSDPNHGGGGSGSLFGNNGGSIWEKLTAGAGKWAKVDGTVLTFTESDKKYANGSIKVYLQEDDPSLPADGISFGGGSSDSGTILVSGSTMTLTLKGTSYYASYNGTYTKQ